MKGGYIVQSNLSLLCSLFLSLSLFVYNINIWIWTDGGEKNTKYERNEDLSNSNYTIDLYRNESNERNQL